MRTIITVLAILFSIIYALGVFIERDKSMRRIDAACFCVSMAAAVLLTII